jgi:hypothetical protein
VGSDARGKGDFFSGHHLADTLHQTLNL